VPAETTGKKGYNRWLMALSLALILALATYGHCERLEPVVIACRIYRSHVFFTNMREPRSLALSTGVRFLSARWLIASELDDTSGDAFFYGVSVLRDVGYFRREDRFWTDQQFPGLKDAHQALRAQD
jgi:hypothetical protein